MLDGGLADEDCDDMVNLQVLDAGTILRNLESRFGMTKPYTYVGRIVISTNPFQWIEGLYSDETIVAYSRVPDVFADLRPHVYAVARDALDNLTQQQVRARLGARAPHAGRPPPRGDGRARARCARALRGQFATMDCTVARRAACLSAAVRRGRARPSGASNGSWHGGRAGAPRPPRGRGMRCTRALGACGVVMARRAPRACCAQPRGRPPAAAP